MRSRKSTGATRIWPSENPGPKPPLHAVLSDEAIRAKVEHYLRESNAPEAGWHGPLTAAQLQAELNRIARDTRDPQMLRELFLALGHDPFVIAETLVRQTLVDRAWRPRASPPMGGESTAAHGAFLLPAVQPGSPCAADAWSTATGPPIDPRYLHAAVWTGSEMIVWGDFGGIPLNSGGRYHPVTDSWSATTSVGAAAERYWHTAVWTGGEMVVWGGLGPGSLWLNSGGRYDPLTDSWSATTGADAPFARYLHTAVWTGSEMIVWGGRGGIYLASGGRYDPLADSWSATSFPDAPESRIRHTAVWTGSEMIVWGGFGGTAPTFLNSGGRYDPLTDSWVATSSASAPAARRLHTTVWTGDEMIVWGGEGDGAAVPSSGGSYDPAADSWIPTSTAGVPAGRRYHTAVWTGSEMIVWGGYGRDLSGQRRPLRPGQ